MWEIDADWSGVVNDRKSTTGYYFTLNEHGGAFSWDINKHATLTFLSKAEYQGMAAAAADQEESH